MYSKTHRPLSSRGLNAQWNYDNHQSDLHTWNTAYGFEPGANNKYIGKKYRKALPRWLMAEHTVPSDTVVLLECCAFAGGYDLG